MIKKLSLIILCAIPGKFVLAAKAYTPFSAEGRRAIVKGITSKSRKDSLSSLREIEKSVGIIRSKLYVNHHQSFEGLKTALRNNDLVATQGWLTVLFESPALEGLSREEINIYHTFLAQGQDTRTEKMFQDFRFGVMNELSEHLLLYPDEVTQQTNRVSMVGTILRSLKAVGMEEPFVKLFVKEDLLSKGEGDLSIHFKERCVRDLPGGYKFVKGPDEVDGARAEIFTATFSMLSGYKRLIQRMKKYDGWQDVDRRQTVRRLRHDVEIARDRWLCGLESLPFLQNGASSAPAGTVPVELEKGLLQSQDNGQKTVQWLSM